MADPPDLATALIMYSCCGKLDLYSSSFCPCFERNKESNGAGWAHPVTNFPFMFVMFLSGNCGMGHASGSTCSTHNVVNLSSNELSSGELELLGMVILFFPFPDVNNGRFHLTH